jgi:zinc resistance-associated protein
MKTALILATTAALLGGSVLAYNVYAQQQPPARSRWQPSAADIGAFANARIAAIHAGLALNADQEKLWPPVETVLKDIAKRRTERFEKFRAERQAQTPAQPPAQTQTPAQPTPPDAITRMRRGAEFMGERAVDLKKLADAAQPLYEKLDDGQKNRFGMLLRAGTRPGMQNRFARWRDRADARGDDRRDHWRDRGPTGPRFGQRENDGPRRSWRDDDGPRGPRMGRRDRDERLGLQFDEQGERL